MKTVICGIGNRARGDDGVGPVVIEELNKQNPGKDILLIDCETAPENFTGMIKKFKPGRVMIIDAVDMKEEPGTVRRIDVNKIKGKLLSTHKLSILLFIQYLKKSMSKLEIIFLGIQPKQAGFSREMSKECRDAVEKTNRVILEMIK